MTRHCITCDADLPVRPGRGRPRLYCDEHRPPGCVRTAAYRKRWPERAREKVRNWQAARRAKRKKTV